LQKKNILVEFANDQMFGEHYAAKQTKHETRDSFHLSSA